MSRVRQDPLRALMKEERSVLSQITRSHNEPASHVARAKMLLAVAEGKTHPDTGAKNVACTRLHPGRPSSIAANGSATGPTDHAADMAARAGGLSVRFMLPQALPPLRMLLVLDNLAGHKTPDFCPLAGDARHHVTLHALGWFLAQHGGTQRVPDPALFARRALTGQSPDTPERIIHDLEAVAAHWNLAPAPLFPSLDGHRNYRNGYVHLK